MKKIYKILKKILAAEIIFYMCAFGFLNYGAQAKDNGANTEPLLNRLGISAVYNESALITRGDFTVLAVQALHLGSLFEETIFSDVDGEQGKYINAAAQMGIVAYSETGKFYPERIITIEEATAICLRILGYGDILRNQPYPSAYMMQASKLNLMRGVKSGSYLTGADAAKMIFNTLDTEYIEPSITGNAAEISYKKSNVTYLDERFGVRKISGRITSVCGLALNGYSTLEKNKIAIDSVIYDNIYYSDVSCHYYLGHNVSAYLMDNENGKELIYIEDKNTAKKVDFHDVESVTGFNVNDAVSDKKNPKLSIYDKEKESSETLRLDSAATIVLNGVQSVCVFNEDFIGDAGNITLTDSDKDGSYDVIFISHHTYYHVDYFDINVGNVSDQHGKETIKLLDFDEEDVSVTFDGKEVGMDAIVNDAILKVTCSYKADGKIDCNKPIVLTVETQTVEGTIEGIREENIFSIGGKEYNAVANITEELKERIGCSTTFLLGEDNIIVDYVPFKDASALNYGYLVNLGNEKSLGYDFSFRIFSDQGKMLTLKLADDFRFTGVYNGEYLIKHKIKEEQIAYAIASGQLVRYQLDENGKLAFLEQAYDRSNEQDYKGFDTDRFTLDWKADSGTMWDSSIGNIYTANNNTLAFYVNTSSKDEEDFEVGYYFTRGYTHQEQSMKVYNSGRDLIAGAVVFEDNKGHSAASEGIFSWICSPVSDKRKKLNDDGDYVTQLDLNSGTPVNGCVAKSDDLKCLNDEYYNILMNVNGEAIVPADLTFEQLEIGDVILYQLGRDGKVDAFVVVGRADKTQQQSFWKSYSTNQYGDSMARFNIVQGHVTDFEKGSYVKVDGADNQPFAIGRSSVSYYEIDIRNKTVTRRTGVPYLDKGDYIWLSARRNNVATIVKYISN